MAGRRMTLAQPAALLAGCSGSKTAPSGRGPDANPGAGATSGGPRHPLPDGPYRYPDPAGALYGNTKHALARTPAEVMIHHGCPK
jgi:hypothetical protein